MVKVRRQIKGGDVQDAIVNPASVLYVFPQNPGSYIVFQDSLDEKQNVVPMGIASPDTVETVRKRLNLSYWKDLAFRLVGLLISAVAVIVAIKW